MQKFEIYIFLVIIHAYNQFINIVNVFLFLGIDV